MQNFVMERVLCVLVKVDAHLVGGGADPAVHDGGVPLFVNRLNRTNRVPLFLAVGRNPVKSRFPVDMKLMLASFRPPAKKTSCRPQMAVTRWPDMPDMYGVRFLNSAI